MNRRQANDNTCSATLRSLNVQLGTKLLGPGLHTRQPESLLERRLGICDSESVVSDLQNEVRRFTAETDVNDRRLGMTNGVVFADSPDSSLLQESQPARLQHARAMCVRHQGGHSDYWYTTSAIRSRTKNIPHPLA